MDQGSYDTAVVKTEVFDLNLSLALVNSDCIPDSQRKILKRMLKERHNGNELRVHYMLGKDSRIEESGRLWADTGMQRLERNIRNSLACKYYWDIDMVNASPTLLLQIAERHGWKCVHLKTYCEKREELLSQLNNDRTTAKSMITPLFFGQIRNDLPEFYKDYLRPEIDLLASHIEHNLQSIRRNRDKWSILSKYIHDIEKQCLIALDRALTRRERRMDTYIHDGGFVRKLGNESELSKELITACEEDVFRDTGYKIKLIVKPMTSVFTNLEDQKGVRVGNDVTIDHVYAAEAFYKLYKDEIVLDSDVLWIFERKTGVWTSKDSAFCRAITEAGSKLKFIQTGYDGQDIIHNFSGNVKNGRFLLDKLATIVLPQNGYFYSRSDSAFGKLLFSDGIYDFTTDTFSKGFNPTIVFHFAIPRPFPKETDPEAIAFVKNTLFRDPFKHEEVGDVYLHFIMRGIIGDYRMKKLLICIGRTNSTKGTACEMLRNTFGDAIGSFTGDSLHIRTGDVEATKALSWVKRISNKRISFSNEMTCHKKSLNANLLNTLASGGDEITIRRNFMDEEVVINQSLITLFVNDLPPIVPVNDAIRERLVPLRFDYSFVNNPVAKFEKLADPSLKKKLKELCYLNGFIHLIIRTYKEWADEGFVEPILPEQCTSFKDELAPIQDWKEVLETAYEITGNGDDFVLSRELIEFLRNEGLQGSDNAIGRILTDLGLVRDQQKLGGRKEIVRYGIRRKTEE